MYISIPGSSKNNCMSFYLYRNLSVTYFVTLCFHSPPPYVFSLSFFLLGILLFLESVNDFLPLQFVKLKEFTHVSLWVILIEYWDVACILIHLMLGLWNKVFFVCISNFSIVIKYGAFSYYLCSSLSACKNDTAFSFFYPHPYSLSLLLYLKN